MTTYYKKWESIEEQIDTLIKYVIDHIPNICCIKGPVVYLRESCDQVEQYIVI